VCGAVPPRSRHLIGVADTPRATEFPIGQYGPRHLWDEAIAAYDWWASVGRPDYSRFRLTVSPDGEQHAWLDSPQHPLPRFYAGCPSRAGIVLYCWSGSAMTCFRGAVRLPPRCLQTMASPATDLTAIAASPA
jgi:hypothetical protein